MTREDAINRLMEYAQYSYGIWHNGEEDDKAFDMAIEALSAVCDDCIWNVCNYNKVDWDVPSAEGGDAEVVEAKTPYMQQSPNNGADLISRQDAIDALGDEPEVWNETDAEWAERDSWVLHKVAIESLPSAEAVQGEWIDIDNYYRMATCSHCHKVTMFEKWGEYTKPYDYCPNCGARMKGGDSE